MSYDLSFEKWQMWLLGAMAAFAAVLLLAAGYLIGRLAGPPAGSAAAAPAPTVVVAPAAPAPVRAADPAVVDAAPSAASDLAAGDSGLVAGNAAVPAPGDAPAVAEAVAPAPVSVAPVEAAPLPAIRRPRAAVAPTVGAFTLQFGVFHDTANAQSMLKDLVALGIRAHVDVLPNSMGEELSAVRAGSYNNVRDALQAARQQSRVARVQVVVRPGDRL